MIKEAFEYSEKIEKYSENTRAYTDLAIWMSHTNADLGCSKLLQTMHLEYDVLDAGADPSPYRCIILTLQTVFIIQKSRGICLCFFIWYKGLPEKGSDPAD